MPYALASAVLTTEPSTYVRVSKVFSVSQQHSPSRPGNLPSVIESGVSCGMLPGGIEAPAPRSVTLEVTWFSLDVNETT